MRTDISLLCFVEVVDEESEHYGKRGQVTDAYTHEHPKWVVYFDDGKHLGSERTRFHTEQLKRVWSFYKDTEQINNCGVCNQPIQLDHACQNRTERDGTLTSYHMSCNAKDVEPCSDCGHHKKLCTECAE